MSLKDHQNPNGTYDGVGALSELTGISRDDVASTFERVKANNALLESCAWHWFVLNPDIQAPLDYLNRHLAYKCVHCGGTITPAMYKWHQLGRRPQGDKS